MSPKPVFDKRLGALLADKEKHEEAHKNWSRRSFIQTSGLAAFGLSTLLGKTPIMAAAENTWLRMLQNIGAEDRILVLINLNGGNDGLNTVIDRFNQEYYRIRPTIAIQESNLWPLNDAIGMHNATQRLRPLWDNGQMRVIQNVGYANPNYSHFRSSDIWATATESNVVGTTGWIGRFIQEEFPAFLEAQPTTPPAVQIGVQTDLAFKSKDISSALAFRNPEEFYQLAASGNLYPTEHLGNALYDQELTFLRRTANSAFRYSNTIRQAYNSARSTSVYPNVNFGRGMSIVARLIKGGLKTKVYMVTLGGFDTHADQFDFHATLMQRLGNAVAAFYEDLGPELSRKVLSMTTSEFGRTIFENGSVGTDHGTGAPMLLFGGDIGQGVFGSPPDLLDLDHYGDPYFEIDFKDVYNTVINSWFGIDPRLSEFMLGQKQQTIPGLLPEYTPPLGANAYIVLLGHRTHPEQRHILQIQFATLRDGDVKLEILDKSGQVIRRVFSTYYQAGTHVYDLNRQKEGLQPGKYLYQIKTGGKVYQRPLYLS
jgi:uncharacterized protein (DUF1501 family)